MTYSKPNTHPRACIHISKPFADKVVFHEDLSDRDNCTISIPDTRDPNKRVFYSANYLPDTRRARNEYKETIKDSKMNSIIDRANKRRWGLTIHADTNAHSTAWGNKDDNTRGQELEEIISKENLTIQNSDLSPTYHKGNAHTTIDLTIVNEYAPKIVNWTILKGESLSDHELITMEIDMEASDFLEIPTYKPPRTCARRFKAKMKGKMSKLSRNMENKTKQGHSPSKKELDRRAKQLTETILDTWKEAQNKTPSINAKRKTKTGWSDELLRLKNNLKFLHIQVNDTELDQEEILGKREARRLIRKDKKKLTKLLRQKSETEWKEFCNDVEKTKVAARLGKVLDKRSQALGTMSKEDGSFTSTPVESVTYLADTLLGKGDNATHHHNNKIYNSKEDLKKLNLFINKQRIIKAVKETKKKKAPGPDGIYNEMLVEAMSEIAGPLCEIYIGCVQSGYIPKTWQMSDSAIIAKPGKTDYSKPKSYRIIALTSNLLKVLETLVLWYMKDDLKIEQAMAKNQYGFKKGSSTDAAILKIVDRIQTALKYKNHALVCFLDIEGAFDNVPHKTIKEAVDKTAAKGMISDWIYYMVSNRHIKLKSAGESIMKYTPKGCPQGGVLSPFLWNIVLDPLLKKMKRFNEGQAFADDLNIIETDDDTETLFRNAKNTIEEVTKWCEENGLKISAPKTQVMLWTRSYKLKHPNHLMINGSKIELSDSVKYLGVILDNKLNFNKHIDEMVSKCKRTIFAVKRAVGKKWGLKPHMLNWIYKTLIIPKVTYGCIVWGVHTTLSQRNKIETIQRLMQSLITRCRQGTPKDFLNVMLNMPSLSDKIEEATLKRAITLKGEGHWSFDDYRPDNYQTNQQKIDTYLKQLHIDPRVKTDRIIPKNNLKKAFKIVIPEKDKVNIKDPEKNSWSILMGQEMTKVKQDMEYTLTLNIWRIYPNR